MKRRQMRVEIDVMEDVGSDDRVEPVRARQVAVPWRETEATGAPPGFFRLSNDLSLTSTASTENPWRRSGTRQAAAACAEVDDRSDPGCRRSLPMMASISFKVCSGGLSTSACAYWFSSTLKKSPVASPTFDHDRVRFRRSVDGSRSGSIRTWSSSARGAGPGAIRVLSESALEFVSRMLATSQAGRRRQSLQRWTGRHLPPIA